MNWIHINDQRPENEQDVFYFFEVLGVYKGKYERSQYPEELFDEGHEPVFGNTFYGKKGWLTDDVTHWMPAPTDEEWDGEYPDIPEDYITLTEGGYAHKDEVVVTTKREIEQLRWYVKYYEDGHLTGMVCPVHTHIHIYHDDEKDGYWCLYCERAYDTELVEEDSYKFTSKYERPCPECNHYEEEERYKGGHLEYVEGQDDDTIGLDWYQCDKCEKKFEIGERGIVLNERTFQPIDC